MDSARLQSKLLKAPFTILLADSDDIRRKALRNTIDRCVTEASPTFHLHNMGDGDWEPPVSDELVPNLVLFHWSDNFTQSDEKVRRPVEKTVVRLAYSGGGISQSEKLPKDWTPIPRPLSVATDLSNREWEELLHWIVDPERSAVYLPRALQPDFARVTTALLILCQAFTAMISGEISSSTSESIHAGTRDWWRTPFQFIPSVEERMKNEIGSATLPENTSKFVNWLNAKDEISARAILKVWGKQISKNQTDEVNPNELFVNLVSNVEEELAAALGAQSGHV